MPFPVEFINELKARSPIGDVISRYVTLKRAGSNMVGLCPFHSEKSPSFTVFEDHFHCFGCGAGGDVITFAMRMENLDYPDAVRFLADRAGLPVPEDSFTKTQARSTLTRERSFAMNKLAARHFYDNLQSPEGEEARRYLAGRALSRSTCIRFGLGYAKNDFHDMVDFLHENGYSTEEIKENFLCGLSQKSGKPFDMFRNRVMFPIFDLTGNIIAFGGRVMDDGKPKYLNSSDTVVFKKSRNLFALNFAKNALTGDVKDEKGFVRPGEMILCEGYMDVIAMHQAGFGNAVATLGTAVTSEHARVIKRFASTVFLAYDSDAAGQAATAKAIKILSEVGIDPKVIRIEGAKDPDEYIKKFGAASFAGIVTGSVGQVDFNLKKILNAHDLNDPDDKIAAVSEACAMLAGVDSAVKREVYAQRLAELAGISVDSVGLQVRRSEKAAARKAKKRFEDDMQKKLFRYEDKINPEAAQKPNIVAVEQRILGILMLYPEYFDDPASPEEDVFVTAFNRELFTNLKSLHESGGDLSALNEKYSPDQMAYIWNIRRERESLSVNGLSALREQVALLAQLKQENGATRSVTDKIQSRVNKIKKGE